MSGAESKRELFLISVIGKKRSLNRNFADAIEVVLKKYDIFNKEFNIKRHDGVSCENLYSSLNEAIGGNRYEGYLIVLDTLERSTGIFNPNVMFEFGAVYNLGKPFAVMATEITDTNEYPFDVKAINAVQIPKCLTDYVYKCQEDNSYLDVKGFIEQASDEKKELIEEFVRGVRKNYDASYNEKNKDPVFSDKLRNDISELLLSHNELRNQIDGLSKLYSNTAAFIEGEHDAFSALAEAVRLAKTSLRTTRFANESIVADPTAEQYEFMEALKAKSIELQQGCTRIICNNHPTKWHDIFQILVGGGKGTRVYVRKKAFSIHFELVVIDQRVAFIHFYQQDTSLDEGGTIEGSDRAKVEKLKSTLRIEGTDTCKRLADVFDRLHHRDIDKALPLNPSRTLLGIKTGAKNEETLRGRGYFEIPLDSNIQKWHRTTEVISQFKKAFEEWDIDENDKLDMAAGIALVANETDFLDAWVAKGKLTVDQYKEVLELYKKYKDSSFEPQK